MLRLLCALLRSLWKCRFSFDAAAFMTCSTALRVRYATFVANDLVVFDVLNC